MKNNMQRYFAKEMKSNHFYFSDEDNHHMLNVMRFQNNDKIEVVYEGQLYLANIEKLQPLKVTKEKTLSQIAEKNNITLFLPFMREQKLNLILQKATELGVGAMCFYQAQNSMVKYDEKKKTQKIKRWQLICKEASEQSKRVTIPTVKIVDQAEIINFSGHKLIAHFDTTVTIKDQLKNINEYDTIGILIGPEGGFSEKEIACFLDSGFKMMNLGALVLRVETAPLFILSIINYEQMR